MICSCSVCYQRRLDRIEHGKHEIEFRYEPPITGLYITTAAIVIAFFLLGLVLLTRQADSAPPLARSSGAPAVG